MNETDNTSMKNQPRTLSEVVGLPNGSFAAFLKKKEAVLERIDQEQQEHIRKNHECKLAWAQ